MLPAPAHPQSGPDERLRQTPAIGAAGCARLRGAKPVAFVGLGTIGNRLAAGLAALPLQTILIDKGLVEPVNVGLQQFVWGELGQSKVRAVQQRLQAMRPLAQPQVYAADVRELGSGVLAGCQLIVGAVDSLADRVWLMQAAARLAIPYLDLALDGTGQSLYGRVSGFNPARGTACLCCGWDDSNWQDVQAEQGAAGCAALAGQPEAPPTLTLPGLAEIVAGLGIVQAVRLLLEVDVERVLGRECRINLTTGRLSETTLSAAPNCRLDHAPWRIEPIDRRTSDVTAGELFDRAAALLGPDVTLAASDDSLVRQATCTGCGRTAGLARLRNNLPPCPECLGLLVPLVEHLHDRFCAQDVEDLQSSTWHELGLPPFGAVLARSGHEERAFVFRPPAECDRPS